MLARLPRALAAFALVLAAGAGGYALGRAADAGAVGAPAAGTTRVLYSLDAKQNDKEIISLIDVATSHVYFAMYEFTLKDIADALVRAKERGLDVRGLVDAGESASSYDAPIIAELVAAGIPVETERHADGTGIMHIKAVVTDAAYALGSYNWTNSATTENDEILEIGTDPALRQVYDDLLNRLLEKYRGTAAAKAAAAVSIGAIAYMDAPNHVGDYASVSGTLVDAYAAASGTVFLDFCASYRTCPFSGVIFADDAAKFGDLSRYAGNAVTLTGTISSYNGRAEMILIDPSQLSS
ncbi:MAG TPA: phospholipase D-like domain-containing protein [Candidatus Paceibacterota bacterium]|nr:phospholipase D-like domain-containing protein [Candidatus Paceibacterota bacterium]